MKPIFRTLIYDTFTPHPDKVEEILEASKARPGDFITLDKLLGKDGFKVGEIGHLFPLPSASPGKSNLVLNVLMDAYRKGEVEPKVVIDTEGEHTVWVTKDEE